MFRNTYVEIHLQNLKFNIKKLKQMLGRGFFCPMVKANAYGHGAIEISKSLEEEGVDGLGVALIEEAIELREAGIKSPILHFGPFSKSQAKAFYDYNIVPVVTSLSELSCLLDYDKPIEIHLKIDMEMNRLGVKGDELPRALSIIKDSKILLVGVCTHFALGESLSDKESLTSKSLKKFEGLLQKHKLNGLKIHSLNGDGILSLEGEESINRGARPGLAIYGLGKLAALNGLKPVMSFYSEIVLIKNVTAGETVSYSQTWCADKDTKVAVIAVGYADGYPWALSNKGFVSINGLKAKIIGRVCMDYIIVDVSDLKSATIGCKVLLWGLLKNGEISLQVLADLAGTIPYELLTSVSQRVPRKYINGFS